ncbi:MAG: DUF1186 domain-containing protein [Candidatus Aegiribacteria sp.]|nr:DUF1186 domain-containing protein [Candidatus Aegiribacteria sp.]
MQIYDILNVLENHRIDQFPEEALKEAIRRKQEITPYLLRAIDIAAEEPDLLTGNTSNNLHLFAFYLLAQFREPMAYPIIIKIFKLPARFLGCLFRDILKEDRSSILASVCDGDIVPIKSLIENPSVFETSRIDALISLQILVYEGILERKEVLEYFAELFQHKLEKEPSPLWDHLVYETVQLYGKTLQEHIYTILENDLVNPDFICREDVDTAFSLPEDTVLAHSRYNCRGLVDVHRFLGWLSPVEEVFRSHVPTADRPHHHPASTYVREHPKIGRNDPCPCGSGRKYKKCCGAS